MHNCRPMICRTGGVHGSPISQQRKQRSRAMGGDRKDRQAPRPGQPHGPRTHRPACRSGLRFVRSVPVGRRRDPSGCLCMWLGAIDGRPVVVGCEDFTVLGGSIGSGSRSQALPHGGDRAAGALPARSHLRWRRPPPGDAWRPHPLASPDRSAGPGAAVGPRAVHHGGARLRRRATVRWPCRSPTGRSWRPTAPCSPLGRRW